MIWILPGLVLAGMFAKLGAQAVWLVVLLAAVKVLLLLLLIGAFAIGVGYVLRRLGNRGRRC